jgi:hypothetical protein
MFTSNCRVTVGDESVNNKSIETYLKEDLGVYLEAPEEASDGDGKFSAKKETGISACGAGYFTVSIKHLVSTLKQTSKVLYLFPPRILPKCRGMVELCLHSLITLHGVMLN